MDFFKIIIIGLVGGMSALLANKGIAVFHDGLRPVIPEYFDKRMSRKGLAATSFAMSIGLIIGFGIPLSIGTGIIMIHTILLTGDIIGLWLPEGRKGEIVSFILGAAVSIFYLFGLTFIIDLFKMLPYNFLNSLGKVSLPIIVAFSVTPALAIAKQHGLKKGVGVFIVQLLAYVLIRKYGIIHSAGKEIKISADGIVLTVGMLALIYLSIKQKGLEITGQNEMLLNVFSERVARIKKNILWLIISGGIIAAAASLKLIASAPVALSLLSNGEHVSALIVGISSVFSYLTLVMSTAIITGVYSPAGIKTVFAVGTLSLVLFEGKFYNPIIAFIVGGIVILLEVLLLEVFAKKLDQYPGIREMGDNIRTSMGQVLEFCLLVGGMIAGNEIAPQFGFLFVAGVYVLNKLSKKPMSDLAVGPVAAIALGIIMNLLHITGIWEFVAK